MHEKEWCCHLGEIALAGRIPRLQQHQCLFEHTVVTVTDTDICRVITPSANHLALVNTLADRRSFIHTFTILNITSRQHQVYRDIVATMVVMGNQAALSRPCAVPHCPCTAYPHKPYDDSSWPMKVMHGRMKKQEDTPNAT